MNRIIFFLILWHILFFVPIINNIDAQGTRLIVDSSSFEMLSVRDPFAPQVPQEEIRRQRVEPVIAPVIEAQVIPPPSVEIPPVNVPPVPEDTRPPLSPEPLPGINIVGVVWNTDRPQAIVNGRIAGIGDMVSGLKIVDIQKTGITVLFQNRTEVVEIKH